MAVVIVDGNWLAYRNFVVTGLKLQAPNGRFTGCAFGFLTTLRKVLVESKATVALVAWDSPPYKKNLVAASYKGARRKARETSGFDRVAYTEQLKLLKEILPLFGVTQLAADGIEADELLYRMAVEVTNKNVVLLSGDRDVSLALDLGSNVSMTQNGTSFVTSLEFKQKFDLTPIEFWLCRLFVGDGSDSIEGLRGVGLKTAKKVATMCNWNLAKIVEEFSKKYDRNAVVAMLLKNIGLMIPTEVDFDEIAVIKSLKVNDVERYLFESLEELGFKSMLKNIYWLEPFRRLGG